MIGLNNFRFIVCGSGGHAAHLIALVSAAKLGQVIACCDDDVHRLGTQVMGVPVIGTIAELGKELPAGGDAVGLGIGDPHVRKRLLTFGQRCGWHLPAIIHPLASIAVGASVGDGTVVDAGAVVGARVSIGQGAIIEAGASVAHDTQVGECCHIEAGARILAGARVGRGVRIGAGAVVQRQVVVADGATIASLVVVTASGLGA